jgi:hypothetical protein
LYKDQYVAEWFCGWGLFKRKSNRSLKGDIYKNLDGDFIPESEPFTSKI